MGEKILIILLVMTIVLFVQNSIIIAMLIKQKIRQSDYNSLITYSGNSVISDKSAISGNSARLSSVNNNSELKGKVICRNCYNVVFLREKKCPTCGQSISRR